MRAKRLSSRATLSPIPLLKAVRKPLSYFTVLEKRQILRSFRNLDQCMNLFGRGKAPLWKRFRELIG
jgi:hypothetical protein